jgi:type I restriction enzyme, S subunit
LRVANVYANRFDLSEVFEIGLEKEEVKRVLLRRNDLLIVEGNGSIDQLGRVAIWDEKISPCVHQNHLIKARPSESINVKCTLYFLLSHQGREFIKREAGSTSGLHTLSLSKVENLKIPLSSKEEQEQIVEEIESRLSICDRLEDTIIENLQKAEALRQSILKQAFEGKLVPQDPNDEPAEKLLERIKQEKTKSKPEKQLSLENSLEDF